MLISMYILLLILSGLVIFLVHATAMLRNEVNELINTSEYHSIDIEKLKKKKK